MCVEAYLSSFCCFLESFAWEAGVVRRLDTVETEKKTHHNMLTLIL